MIGDSQTVGPFGQQIHELLIGSSHVRVKTIGAWGSSPIQWLGQHSFKGVVLVRDGKEQPERCSKCPSPTYESIVSKEKGDSPHLTVVQLGGNMLAFDRETNRSTIRQLIRFIHSKKSACAWVGPSQGMRDPVRYRELYDDLIQIGREENCLIIDSRELTYYPLGAGDGVHFQFLGIEGILITRRWACGVIKQLSKHFAFVKPACENSGSKSSSR